MGLTEHSSFIKACYGKNDDRIPIWIMRQAGRYLPEYRAVRERVSFAELCRTPSLIAEVVRQPVEKFGFDAAILFSDILTMLEPMGVGVKFDNGGPRVEKPIETPKDVGNLRNIEVNQDLPFVLDGIREIKKMLPDTPLIGFAGSPFTLACYMIQGRGTNGFEKAKSFLHKYPDAADSLIGLLADAISHYLRAQIDAGANAVQLFDSWGGILSQEDYRHFGAEPIDKIFRTLRDRNVPRILFVNNLAPYIDQVRSIDCEVIGVDYRMDLANAAELLPKKSVQGNLDPTILFGSRQKVISQTKRILGKIKDHNRVIFNLGHGILPETPIESVEALVETVHDFRSSR